MDSRRRGNEDQVENALSAVWHWLAGLVWRWIKTVIPGEAQRRPGIHTPLKETGFPPSRE